MNLYLMLLVVTVLTSLEYRDVLAYSTAIDYYGAIWDQDPLSVGVYIDSRYMDRRDEYGAITNAFTTWSEAVKMEGDIPVESDVFRFNIEFHEGLGFLEEHNIYVGVTHLPNSTDRVGFTKLYSVDENIIASIMLLEADLNEEQLYEVALHQVGHALGLKHTTDENHKRYTDIMFEANDAISFHGPNRISRLDATALLFLYSKDGFGSFNRDTVPVSYRLQFGN
jgi:hypothetical protein